MAPYGTSRSLEDGGSEYEEKWVVYRSPSFSAKELTVKPGKSVTIRDTDAYGAIVVQGHGTIGVHAAAAATVIRFGQLSQDEFFVSSKSANEGVSVTNRSTTDDLVMLKHFGPGNVELDLRA